MNKILEAIRPFLPSQKSIEELSSLIIEPLPDVGMKPYISNDRAIRDVPPEKARLILKVFPEGVKFGDKESEEIDAVLMSLGVLRRKSDQENEKSGGARTRAIICQEMGLVKPLPGGGWELTTAGNVIKALKFEDEFTLVPSGKALVELREEMYAQGLRVQYPSSISKSRKISKVFQVRIAWAVYGVMFFLEEMHIDKVSKSLLSLVMCLCRDLSCCKATAEIIKKLIDEEISSESYLIDLFEKGWGAGTINGSGKIKEIIKDEISIPLNRMASVGMLKKETYNGRRVYSMPSREEEVVSLVRIIEMLGSKKVHSNIIDFDKDPHKYYKEVGKGARVKDDVSRKMEGKSYNDSVVEAVTSSFLSKVPAWKLDAKDDKEVLSKLDVDLRSFSDEIGLPENVRHQVMLSLLSKNKSFYSQKYLERIKELNNGDNNSGLKAEKDVVRCFKNDLGLDVFHTGQMKGREGGGCFDATILFDNGKKGIAVLSRVGINGYNLSSSERNTIVKDYIPNFRSLSGKGSDLVSILLVATNFDKMGSKNVKLKRMMAEEDPSLSRVKVCMLSFHDISLLSTACKSVGDILEKLTEDGKIEISTHDSDGNLLPDNMMIVNKKREVKVYVQESLIDDFLP
jgi:hypothetical protein